MASIFVFALRWLMAHPLRRGQWIALGLWLAVTAGWMVALGDHIARTTNRRMEHSDQKTYLLVMQQNRRLAWPAATDGIRNPLFPWLLAKTARGRLPEMFDAGKRLNIRCGALVLIALGIWAGSRLPWLPAAAFSSIAGLGVILPVSTYAGAEVLYYGLFFLAWMAAFSVLDRLAWPRCVLLGFLLALAYLAKPGVTLFCGCLALAAALRWRMSRRAQDAEGWTGWRPLAGAAIALAVAMPMVLPRAIHAQKRFGDPFQNTAAKCFWAEDWSACLPILNDLNPRGIERIPPGERPSARRYFSRHTTGDAVQRLLHGTRMQIKNLMAGGRKSVFFMRAPSRERPIRRLFPYRGWFLLPPLLLVLGFWGMLAARGGADDAFTPANVCRLTFAGLLIGASGAAFAWYFPISPGARFVMALYLPALACLALAEKSARDRLATAWADGLSAAVWLAMAGLFLTHLAILSRHPVFGELRTAF